MGSALWTAVGGTAVMAELDAPKVIDLDGFPRLRREAGPRNVPEASKAFTRPREVLLLMRIAPLMGPKSAGAFAIPQGDRVMKGGREPRSVGPPCRPY